MIGQISLAAIFLLILMTLKVPAPREVARTFAPLIPNQREDRKIVLNNIEAKSVFIFDISQNKMLYEKNSSDPLPLASLTKLMTILLLEEKSRDGGFIPISQIRRVLILQFLRPGSLALLATLRIYRSCLNIFTKIIQIFSRKLESGKSA